MIKDLEVLRPSRYRNLINFDHLPENSDTQLIHVHDGESIDLWYKQEKVCYIFPSNQFYQFSRLQNPSEKINNDLNRFLIRGILESDNKIMADMKIENEQTFNKSNPEPSITREYVHLIKLPETRNDIVIEDNKHLGFFHHFSCSKVVIRSPNQNPLISLTYLKSYNDISYIINYWLDNNDMIITK